MKEKEGKETRERNSIVIQGQNTRTRDIVAISFPLLILTAPVTQNVMYGINPQQKKKIQQIYCSLDSDGGNTVERSTQFTALQTDVTSSWNDTLECIA